MLRSEPIFGPSRNYPSCHASTLVELSDGQLLAAWFAGTHEGHPDVAVWLSSFDGERWSEPRRVAHEADVPLWNPVLFLDSMDTVWLFYKVGPSIPAWTAVYIKSRDGGRSWSAPRLLPAGLLGPAKNKPITLSNGDILCGTSSETWRAWACWVEISRDGGQTWSKHGPIVLPGHGEGNSTLGSASWDAERAKIVVPQDYYGVIQPAIWEYAPGRLKMLMRATLVVGTVCSASSDDYGRSWSIASPTTVPNPNSGLDAVRLMDSRIVMACNPTEKGRTPLSLLLSEDNGQTWPWQMDLETDRGEYSYPSIIQAQDGRLHLVYTYQRTHIRHATLEPDDLL